MKKNIHVLFLAVIGLFFIFFAKGNEMSLILPLAIFVYLFRNKLRSLLEYLSFSHAFILSGITIGLLTELFAIVANLDLPYDERALLSPYPIVDIFLAILWYGLFILVWLFLLKKYHYSYIEIFIIAGIYGLLFEQEAVFIPLLITPQFILPLFIMAVYSFFPMLAYMLTKHKFPIRINKRFPIRYSIAMVALIAHATIWKLCGLIYYPILDMLGYMEHLK